MLSHISVRDPRPTSRSEGRPALLCKTAVLLLPLSLAGSFFFTPAPSQARITPAQAAIHNARLARRQAVLQAHLAMQHPPLWPGSAAAKQAAQHQARLAKLLAARDSRRAADDARAAKALAAHQAHLIQVQIRQQAQMLKAQAAHLAHLQHAQAWQQARGAAHQATMTVAARKNTLKYAKLHRQHVALVSGNVVEAAYAFRGTRYVMGGTSRSGFDCSGFVRYILSNAGGVAIPRTAVEQFIHGASVAPDAMQPGDLVFFKNTYKHGISHVGIYAGDGQFIHAANAHKGVRMDSLSAPYYAAHFAGARRVLPAQMRAAAFLNQ